MTEMPPALRAAVEREADGVSRRGLAERAGALSAAYRAGAASSRAIAHEDDALAYALVRAPATYAACAAVLAEAQDLAPDFAPSTVLDAGAGTGVASWAALETWDSLDDVTQLDSSAPFHALAARLAQAGAAPLQNAKVLAADLSTAADLPQADLVLASYVLAEIAAARLPGVVEALWKANAGLLALVEPGTPAGFDRILAARAQLIAAGAEVLAPCPHAAPCPLAAPDWCHFAQRLPRSRDHRLAKGADAPFEDEKYAYLVAARPGLASAPAAARILAPPRAGKPGIEFKLCGPAGLETRFVPRRDKPAHAKARRLGWGDRLSD